MEEFLCKGHGHAQGEIVFEVPRGSFVYGGIIRRTR